MMLTWNRTENMSPNASVSLRGTTANQRMEERKRERSQKKADNISRMTRTGSAAMVKMNLERKLKLQDGSQDMLHI